MSADATREAGALGRFGWSLRRELWESRSVCLAPAIVAGVFLIGFAISLGGLPEEMRTAASLGPAERAAAVQQPYVMVALMLMAIGLVVAVVYSLDALYGERRDRSVLFWKSMPVTDLTTVLAKASVPIFVVPLVTCAVTVATQVVMLLASAAVLAGAGVGTGILWGELPILDLTAANLAHLLGFHGIGYAPLYAWLLLASAWARRMPLLWAALPPAGVIVLERIAFGSTRFAALLQHHLLGGPLDGPPGDGVTMEVLGLASLGPYLSRPDPWIGLALAALFLAAASRLHRVRGPI